MTIKDNHTSGWSYLSDLEMARWQASERNMPLDWLTLEPAGELIMRGIKLKSCAECGEERLVYNHDYKCILCRAS